MADVTFAAAFLVGLAGSVHCIGMCGGVVSAFSFATPQHANKEVYTLAYNAGRILTYVILGALTGFIGSIISSANVTDLPILDFISIGFLFLLAFYISDIWKGLSHLERLGSIIWRRVQPLSKKFIPIKTPFHAMIYGAIWGFLPCGLIYSSLTWSLSSQSAIQGAGMMLAFGLGTMPALILISLGFQSILPIMQKRATRLFVAFLLALSAIVLLYRQFQGTVI
ncbi:MAG: sulfite exporter TauE/SafE family protein [Pseudomonadota bacterium]